MKINRLNLKEHPIDTISTAFAFLAVTGFYIVPLVFLLYKKLSIKIPITEASLEPIWSSIKNGFEFAAISSFLQIFFGFLIAYFFTFVRDDLENQSLKKIQLLIDSIIILPYLIPSICWKWISDELFKYQSGLLDSFLTKIGINELGLINSANGRLAILYAISTMYLFPFSYLAFRYFISSISIKEQTFASSLGIRGFNYILRYRGSDIIKTVLIVLLFRFFIMQGKFDLPFLFGGSNYWANEKMLTLPVWVKFNILTTGLNSTVQIFINALIVIFLIFIPLIFIYRICQNRKRAKNSSVNTNLFINLVIRMLLKVEEIIGLLIIKLYKIKILKLILKASYKVLRLIFIILGYSFVFFTLFTIIYILFFRCDLFEGMKQCFSNKGYRLSLLSTLIYYLSVIIIAPVLAYFILTTVYLKKGFGVPLIETFCFVYYVIPPAVYFVVIILIGSPNLPFIYILSLYASIIPLIYYQLRIALWVPNIYHTLYLYNQPIGFVRSYAKLNSNKNEIAGQGISIAISVIVINELFGSLHILEGSWKPIAVFLWQAKESYIGNMSIVFSAVFPVVIFSYIMIYIVSKYFMKLLNPGRDVCQYN